VEDFSNGGEEAKPRNKSGVMIQGISGVNTVLDVASVTNPEVGME